MGNKFEQCSSSSCLIEMTLLLSILLFLSGTFLLYHYKKLCHILALTFKRLPLRAAKEGGKTEIVGFANY